MSALGSALDLLRPDLRSFAGYASARRASGRGSVWLNANESPEPSLADPGLGLNRYPEPQPGRLRERLAQVQGVRAEQLLITRGSDDGIDLLVRAFCRAGSDGVLIAPPCFGMYAVCARVQGAPLVEAPLLDLGTEWAFDLEAIVSTAIERQARLVFLCSPANPTGQALTLAQVRRLALGLSGQAVLVVDEAYVEYSAIESAAVLLDELPNLVVLRTLSKAHALAGARIGTVLGDAALIAVLRNIAPPYPVPAPSAALALEALSDEGLAQARRRCAVAIAEREVLLPLLAAVAGVTRVYPSQGNYLLARFTDSPAAFERLLEAGVVVRDMRAMPGLHDALRISIGAPDENRRMLRALRGELAA